MSVFERDSHRRQWRAAALGALAAAVLAGAVWWHERPPAAPAAAQVAAEVLCPGPREGPDAVALNQALPRAGSVPVGFAPVAVVSCHGGALSRTLDAHGRPGGTTAATAVEVRRTGDMSALLVALAQRAQPQQWAIEAWWGAHPPLPQPHCARGYMCDPALWLVDREGRAIRPAIPRLRSGAAQPAAHEAIAQLTVDTVVYHDLQCPLLDVKPAPDDHHAERSNQCQPS